MYIHQNPKNANLSALVNDFKQDVIISQQMSIVNAKKAQVQQLFESSQEAKEKLKETLESIQKAGEQTTKALSTVGFKGILGKGGTIKSGITPEQLQQRIKAESENLEKYAEVLQKFVEIGPAEGSNGIFTDKEISNMQKMQSRVQDAIKKLNTEGYEQALGEITGIASDIIGSLSEYHTGQLLKEMGFEAFLTGAESGMAYRAKTSDIQIAFEGVDEMKIGISQKRTRQLANAKTVLAKVKTATLDSLLSASQINVDRESLYNVIANHGREIFEFDESQGQYSDLPSYVYNYEGWGQLVKKLHYAFALTALAGDLTNEDFAIYMLINDKIYSILDLITKLFNNEKGLSISSTLSVSQKEIAQKHYTLVKNSIDANDYVATGRERSNTMINTINHMSIVVKANIQLAAAMNF